MSFYKSIFAAVVAVALASPVLAQTQNPDVISPSANGAPNAQAAPEGAMQQQAAPTASSEVAAPAESKIDLNKASAKELMKVKGINASKARAIVAYRKKHGNFKSIDGLAKVKGFTRMKGDSLKVIQDQVVVE